MQILLKNILIFYFLLQVTVTVAQSNGYPNDSLKQKKAKLEAFISFDKAHRNFIYDKNNAGAVNCACDPNNQEHFRLNYSIGLLRIINLNKSIKLQTGIHYENIRFFTDTVVYPQQNKGYYQFVYNGFNYYLGAYSKIYKYKKFELGISAGTNIKFIEQTLRSWGATYTNNFKILSKRHDFFMGFDIAIKFPIISFQIRNKFIYFAPNYRYSFGYTYNNAYCQYFENGEWKYMKGRISVKGIALGIQF